MAATKLSSSVINLVTLIKNDKDNATHASSSISVTVSLCMELHAQQSAASFLDCDFSPEEFSSPPDSAPLLSDEGREGVTTG